MAKYNWKKHKEQGYGYWMQTPDGEELELQLMAMVK
jgi:hypothetical protein